MHRVLNFRRQLAESGHLKGTCSCLFHGKGISIGHYWQGRWLLNPREIFIDVEDMFMWNIDASMIVQWCMYKPMIVDVHASTRGKFENIVVRNDFVWHSFFTSDTLNCKNLKHLEVEWLRFAVEAPFKALYMMFVNRNCSFPWLLVFMDVPGVVVGYSFLAGDFPERVGKQTPLPDC